MKNWGTKAIFYKFVLSLFLGLTTLVSVPSMARAVEPVEAKQEMSIKTESLTDLSSNKSRFVETLIENPIGSPGVTNFLQVLIRGAVERGVPANTIVLMLMFPMVAALIAAARHIVGLQGFGIFTPAVVSVAFLATGVTVGVLLFISILVLATLGRMMLKKLRLPTVPRNALLLWFVSLGALLFILVSPWLGLESLISINIFPILLLVLLAETFIEVQITRSFQAALEMTAETVLLALIAFFMLSMEWLQIWVLLHPEMTIILIAMTDVLIGRYGGLRLMERWRFRELLQD